MRIRVSNGLREKLIELAERNGRSLNAEVVNRLEASLSDADQISKILARLSALESKL
jgi:hypothetical protein